MALKLKVYTIFPEIFPGFLGFSLTGRALEEGIWSLETVNIRDYALDKHGSVDDTPCGGGAGMVMQAEPVYLAWESVVEKLGRKPKVLYMSPQGRVFDQTMAQELAEEEDMLFFRGVTHPLALKKRYKDLIKIYHPDNSCGDKWILQQINTEYDRLKNVITYQRKA